ncbi:restriction endonuclease, partial [Candidatus Poribacteria bacterium]
NPHIIKGSICSTSKPAIQTVLGTTTTTVIECKAYERPVDVNVITSFGAVAHLLKQRGLADRAVIVAASGFTAAALSAAKKHGVELLEYTDLRARVSGRENAVKSAHAEFAVVGRSKRQKCLFVVMPFSKEFQDIYILGIREVAEKLGLVVERADDIEHNAGILDVILERISNCDMVVADTTGQNPNVFYEIGYSHAMEKAAVLITRTGENIPFDLRSMNHIFYDNIVELREKLEKRLQATLFL